MRLIEPGVIRTDFYTRSMDRSDAIFPPEYSGVVEKALARQERMGRGGSPPEAAARVIYRAATSRGSRLRYLVGGDARLVLVLRSVLPYRLFRAIFRKTMIG